MKVIDGAKEPVDYLSRWDFDRLIDDHGLKVGVEVGVLDGAFSRGLLQSRIEKLYSVDTWQYRKGQWDEINYATAAVTLKAFGSRSEMVKAESGEAAKRFGEGELDFVYMDAHHSKRAVERDVKLWFPKLRTGGVIAGHDWVREEDDDRLAKEHRRWKRKRSGVRQAISGHCEGRDVVVTITGEPLASFWFKKW